jgi:hypothetical protein
MELLYRRPDGTFVAIINGYPYHVTEDDTHFAEASTIADALGNDLPFEPLPPEPDQTVTIDMVAAERKRRLAMGFDYDFGDARGVHRIGTTEADLENWTEVNTVANAAINLGQGSTATIDILTDTGPATVTALEWQSVLLQAGMVRQPIFAASFALQAIDPIPLDYTDDSYWP